ncbi:Uncharacterised protein [Enterobacter cloacae]|nr:Uncharacterised protein [Enterobacter cloacae]
MLRQCRRTFQYRNMTQNAFFITAWLNYRLFLLSKMPLIPDMFEGKLLSGAHPFFIAPESHVVKMAVGLDTNTGQAIERTVFTH